jgi:hypothetical protein
MGRLRMRAAHSCVKRASGGGDGGDHQVDSARLGAPFASSVKATRSM